MSQTSEANLNLELLASVLDRVVIEGLDDLVTGLATLEAVEVCQWYFTEVSAEASVTYRAKPTPRP